MILSPIFFAEEIENVYKISISIIKINEKIEKNLNTMRKFFTIVLFFLLVLKGFSQDTIRISRAELEQRMVDQNLQVKLANDEAKLAQSRTIEREQCIYPT